MNDEALETLLEAATTAYRERDAEGRLVPPPAWFDLPPDALPALYARQVLAREVERQLDPEGYSATAQAVLVRLELL